MGAREVVQQFLEADIFSVSVENGVPLLTPLIEGWDIDLATFGMEVVLHEGMAEYRKKRFGFFESRAEEMRRSEPGLEEFLRDKSLSGDVSEEEIEFLRTLEIAGAVACPDLLLSGATEFAGSVSLQVVSRKERKAGAKTTDAERKLGGKAEALAPRKGLKEGAGGCCLPHFA